jgi:hypothetical protein
VSQNFRLRNDSLFVVASAAGGFFNPDQLRAIATVCESGSALLKLTEDGTIGFMIEEVSFTALEEQLRGAGVLLRHYRSDQPPFARACLGEMCPMQEQDALGHALEITGYLQERFTDPLPYLRVGMNGCARNCLASGTDDIHIVGESTGYKVQIGGKASEIPQNGHFLCENVSAEDLGPLLAHIIDVYLREREPTETLHDVVERCGVGTFDFSGSAGLAAAQELASTGENDVIQDDLDLDSIDLDNIEDSLGSNDLADVDPSLDADTDELGVGLLAEDDALLHANDLDDTTLQLGGAVNTSQLTALTLSAGASESSELADSASSELADEMMEEESHLEAKDASEADVSRVTDAMRSEASFDQVQDSPSGLSALADGPSESAHGLHETNEPQPDLPLSFLRLQDQAAHKGAVQVRVLEDLLCVTTPLGIRLTLPLQDLQEGTKVVMDLGDETLECQIGHEGVQVRVGSLSLLIPTNHLAPRSANAA